MRNSSRTEADMIASAIRTGDISQLEPILALVQQTGAIAYTLDCAKTEVAAALRQVDMLPDSSYRKAMIEVAEFALARTY
jgi:octaprenyl-diphosphate synthase